MIGKLNFRIFTRRPYSTFCYFSKKKSLTCSPRKTEQLNTTLKCHHEQSNKWTDERFGDSNRFYSPLSFPISFLTWKASISIHKPPPLRHFNVRIMSAIKEGTKTKDPPKCYPGCTWRAQLEMHFTMSAIVKHVGMIYWALPLNGPQSATKNVHTLFDVTVWALFVYEEQGESWSAIVSWFQKAKRTGIISSKLVTVWFLIAVT